MARWDPRRAPRARRRWRCAGCSTSPSRWRRSGGPSRCCGSSWTRPATSPAPGTRRSACRTAPAATRCSSPPAWTRRPGPRSARCRAPTACSARCSTARAPSGWTTSAPTPGSAAGRAAHPDMRSFLGVPIVAGGEVLAELFLADKAGPDRRTFTDSDQRLIETLSTHAALAVANAQRTERARELSVAEERARLARELHDSVTQTLFSLTLAAESAAALAEPGGPELAEQLDRVRELARDRAGRDALDGRRRCGRSTLGADGLAEALRKRVDLLRRVHDVRLSLRARGPARLQDRTVEREVLLVASEALANALQHAGAASIEVTLDTGGDTVRLIVADDGAGFDLAGTLRESRRLGLTSMRERAEALGGTVHVDTAPGAGTRVSWRCPVPAEVADPAAARRRPRDGPGRAADVPRPAAGHGGGRRGRHRRAGAGAGAAAAAGHRAARPGAAGHVRAGGGAPAAVRAPGGQGRRADQLRGAGLGAARGPRRGVRLPAQGRRPAGAGRRAAGGARRGRVAGPVRGGDRGAERRRAGTGPADAARARGAPAGRPRRCPTG